MGPIPIAPGAVSGWRRDAAGPGYSVTAFDGLVTTGDLLCGPDGGFGDEVVVHNPWPDEDVHSIEIHYADVDGDTPSWLGGPFAVNVVTDAEGIAATFPYRGTYASPTATSAAVDGGRGAVWSEVRFEAEIPSGSRISVWFACGDDDDGDGELEPNELSGGQTLDLEPRSSPAPLEPCVGRFATYKVDLYDRGSGEGEGHKGPEITRHRLRRGHRQRRRWLRRSGRLRRRRSDDLPGRQRGHRRRHRSGL